MRRNQAGEILEENVCKVGRVAEGTGWLSRWGLWARAQVVSIKFPVQGATGGLGAGLGCPDLTKGLTIYVFQNVLDEVASGSSSPRCGHAYLGMFSVLCLIGGNRA